MPPRPKVTIDLPGIGAVLLERSRRARRLSLTVRPGGVRVAVPPRCAFHRAEAFARSRADWIRAQRHRLHAAEARLQRLPLKPVCDDRQAVRTLLTGRLAELAAIHGFRYRRVFLRQQRTRWGSCSTQNNINLNVKLARLPDDLRDYVLLHELVHTRVPRHGPDFWAALEACCPGARRLARQLVEYAPLLDRR